MLRLNGSDKSVFILLGYVQTTDFDMELEGDSVWKLCVKI